MTGLAPARSGTGRRRGCVVRTVQVPDRVDPCRGRRPGSGREAGADQALRTLARRLDAVVRVRFGPEPHSGCLNTCFVGCSPTSGGRGGTCPPDRLASAHAAVALSLPPIAATTGAGRCAQRCAHSHLDESQNRGALRGPLTCRDPGRTCAPGATRTRAHGSGVTDRMVKILQVVGLSVTG